MMGSEHPLAWPMAGRTSEESDSGETKTFSEQRREIATLRARVAQLEAENERLRDAAGSREVK